MKDIRAPTVKLRKISESVIAQPRISDSVHEPLESAGMLMKEQFQQRGRCDLLSEIRLEQTRQRDRARMATRTQALTTNKTDALLAPPLTPDHSDGFKLHPPQTLSDLVSFWFDDVIAGLLYCAESLWFDFSMSSEVRLLHVKSA